MSEDEALHWKENASCQFLRRDCYSSGKSFNVHTNMLSADPELGISNKKGRYK